MSRFETAVEIEAAPNLVWSVMADVTRWPEWTPTVTQVERLEPGPLTRGSRTRILQPKLKPAIWQVTELNEGAGFTWVSRSPGVTVAGRHWFEPTATGCIAKLSLEFSGLLGPLLFRLLRKLSEQYVITEAQCLKRRCEDSNAV